MTMKYILVPDSTVFQIIRQATLYRLMEGERSNPLAPRYTAVSTGPVEELAAIAAQLNEKEQPGEGETPVPLGKVDPLAEMEVENLDRIIHDTKPHSRNREKFEQALNEGGVLASDGLQRTDNTTGRDEPVLTEEQWERIKEQADDDQWTRLTDEVIAFLALSGDTIKAQSLTSWLSHRDRRDTIRIRQVDGKIQIRAEKTER